MLWCQGAQDTGLTNCKVKSVLKCTIWSQCTPDRQTDRRTDVMEIAWWFVLRMHRMLKTTRKT